MTAASSRKARGKSKRHSLSGLATLAASISAAAPSISLARSPVLFLTRKQYVVLHLWRWQRFTICESRKNVISMLRGSTLRGLPSPCGIALLGSGLIAVTWNPHVRANTSRAASSSMSVPGQLSIQYRPWLWGLPRPCHSYRSQ